MQNNFSHLPLWGAQYGYQDFQLDENGQILHAQTYIANDTPNDGMGFSYGDNGGFSVGNFLPWGQAPLLTVWGDFHISCGIAW